MGATLFLMMEFEFVLYVFMRILLVEIDYVV